MFSPSQKFMFKLGMMSVFEHETLSFLPIKRFLYILIWYVYARMYGRWLTYGKHKLLFSCVAMKYLRWTDSHESFRLYTQNRPVTVVAEDAGQGLTQITRKYCLNRYYKSNEKVNNLLVFLISVNWAKMEGKMWIIFLAEINVW